MNICNDLQLHILEFIPNQSKYLSNLQLICKNYKYYLQERLDKVYWNVVENLIGKNETDKIKQGSTFAGDLYLSYKQIGVKTCKILAPALAQMTALKNLGLSNNQIDGKACNHLAPALKEMTALKGLYFGGNKIDAKACEHLAPALANMTALKEISLYKNRIDATGKEMMRKAWKKTGKNRYGLYL